jgi:tyrosinase
VNALNNIRGNMQDQVYNMFSTCDEFVEVGSDAAGSSSVKCSNSIENIHNTIHTTTGGPKTSTSPGGHMTFLATAAFDPLFWLHHCNVDRLFALWQAMYPDSYGGSQVAPHNTWTIAKGTTQNANSPLTPFHKNTGGDFWTTNEVRDTKVFKYTYPEFTRTSGNKAAIVSVVNKLYGPNAAATAGSTKREAAPEPQDDTPAASTTSSSVSSSSSASSSASATAIVDPSPLTANNGSLYQYVANIATNRYALGGSYVIYLFDSPPASEAPGSWALDANLIGPMGVLAQDGMTGAADLVTTGSVPLTRTLTEEVSEGILADLSVATVVPYLQKSLVWRVAGPDGVAVNPETISDFEISVWASTATPATEYELPVWSKFIPLAEITKNKAGGATPSSILQPPTARKARV